MSIYAIWILGLGTFVCVGLTWFGLDVNRRTKELEDQLINRRGIDV